MKNQTPSPPRLNEAGGHPAPSPGEQAVSESLSFDAASRRHVDENGFLHVSLCHISKEAVNEYWGAEIPGGHALGLNPDKIYRGYRPAAELAKAAPTFNGLPLLKEHVTDSAAAPQKALRVGNLGTEARFNAPYLNNALVIQDAEAVAALSPRNGRPARRQLSASYRYDPVFRPGVFQGQAYDFIMTNIRGNHVAIVEEGRAGPDVVVADANTINRERGRNMDGKELLEKLANILSGTGKTPAGGADAEPGAAGRPEPGQPLGADPANAAGAAGSGRGPDADPAEDGDDGDDGFRARLLALIADLEDHGLAALLRQLVEQAEADTARGAGQSARADDEDDRGKDAPDNNGRGQKPGAAMDGKAGRSRAGHPSTSGAAPAMDAKAVAARLADEIRSGLQAQIEAAREVRPLVGDLDPLAFDSAAGIYRKALALIGRPSRISDTAALKELCAMARETRQGKADYPVLASVPAGDAKSVDPAFAHLGNIRKG